jgi:2-C-methyl-D-erythritol 4-phosphate cytidylyltransferase
MTVALIVAAGRGHRLGGPIPKQYRLLDEMPILRRTVAVFLRHPDITGVQVVIHPADLAFYQSAVAGLALPPPVMGGDTRQDSVRLGLEGIGVLGPRNVIIHDAVRPFVSDETIASVVRKLDEVPAVVAAVPVADTLKRCRNGLIHETVDRSDIWRAQTPQGFHFERILAAHRQLHREGRLDLTDDSAVAEHAGMQVAVVHGSDDNFKITTEEDLARAEKVLQRGYVHAG